ncbi:hypothetical protein BKA70DRAFT_643346 [Coprinopsis sp. MPI-PUGE-AT-0042]|nr:hypothetical protein BKA70DRAFT_122912 [Coprinopsis sp. MPI-PUGE-AT-0042]KAH6913756.1 hypothetical protein BKA70DRAFT_643346 [Coprinopsis sp. MPI-PUGE-AT-0042]
MAQVHSISAIVFVWCALAWIDVMVSAGEAPLRLRGAHPDLIPFAPAIRNFASPLERAPAAYIYFHRSSYFVMQISWSFHRYPSLLLCFFHPRQAPSSTTSLVNQSRPSYQCGTRSV